ncbi:Phosphotransferase enzyme family protein [Friedmanniella luteola]|uniref:Phosphotransferase enzyme family protein n=1 Tax=Friedmanniella luteola TaxID=546871 RepID=A0A1H1THC2_9ACTN|nr:phosphotransferase [Friedmanniella luteola]SDS59600.1 Phosphotransferase enzyme family protein [Friedmanniella luteola]
MERDGTTGRLRRVPGGRPLRGFDEEDDGHLEQPWTGVPVLDDSRRYVVTLDGWWRSPPDPAGVAHPRGRDHAQAMSTGSGDGSSAEISDTERAVHGAVTSDQLRAFLDAWARDRLGAGIAEVRFRAGRIDAVWGVELRDGRPVVIKAHRTPVDLEAARATVDAQRALAAAGFPCPLPLAGPEELDGRVLTAETLLPGPRPDGRDPAVRRLLADGLAHHVEILRALPDLVGRAGPGPSWCRYQDGPWPVPHDTLVDLRSTPDEFGWLDALGRRAADQVLEHRVDAEVVTGHADWYAGNTAVVDGRLVGVFDWELVADTEAVIAGFAASCYASSATGGGGLSTPEEAVAFLQDYEQVRGQPWTGSERRAAAGAVAWILAFNARWQVALVEHGLGDEATIALVRDRQEDYLGLSWT